MSSVIYLNPRRKKPAVAESDFFIPLTERVGDGVLVSRDDMNLGLVDIRYINGEGDTAEQISLEPEKALRLAEMLAMYAQKLITETKPYAIKAGGRGVR